MFHITRTQRGSFEPTTESEAIIAGMEYEFNGKRKNGNGEPRSARVHYWVRDAINSLIHISDLYGGEYLSNDGIDEYVNELEAVLDVDFREELYACGYDNDEFADPESLEYRQFASECDTASVIERHTSEPEKQILRVLAQLRSAYFDDDFDGLNVGDEHDAIDIVFAIFTRVMEIIDGM